MSNRPTQTEKQFYKETLHYLLNDLIVFQRMTFADQDIQNQMQYAQLLKIQYTIQNALKRYEPVGIATDGTEEG